MTKTKKQNRIETLSDGQLEQVVGGQLPGDFNNDGAFLQIDGIEGECTVQFDGSDFIIV